MKKDLVVRNFKCGNEVKDITLEVSPITFLVGPNGSGKSFIGKTSSYVKPKNVLEAINNYVIDLQLDFGGSFEFTNSWIKKLGFGDRIEVDLQPQGIVNIFVVNGDNRKPFSQLGKGFIQLLKILLTIDFYKCDDISYIYNTKEVFVENPEINLYPAIQSVLADIYCDAYQKYKMWFLIETHSEYLIVKSQEMVAKRKYVTKEGLEKECPFTTYYVPEKSTGELPYSLCYCKNGKFKKGYGVGFYEEPSTIATDIEIL